MLYMEHWYLDVIAMFTSLMTSIICAFFYSKIFTSKKDKAYFFKYFCLFFSVYLISRMIPLFYKYIVFIVVLSYFIGVNLFSKDKLSKKIFIVFLTYIFMVVIDIPICLVTFSKFGYGLSEVISLVDKDFLALYNTIFSSSNALALKSLNNVILCFLFINLMMIYKKESRHFNIWLVYLIITVLFSFNAILAYYYLDSISGGILIIASSLIVISLLIYFVDKLKMYTKYDEYKNENKFLKEKEKMQYEYYELLREREENVKIISHDIKNNLQIMSKLNNEKERLTIAEDINDSLNKYSLVRYTSQDILNIILNLKVNDAKLKNIDINVDIKTNLKFMDSIDVSNLITNLLDNAIEGANNSSLKVVDFVLKKKMNYIIIKCSNSYDGKLKYNNKKEFISTKDINHGYGTKIIKNVVNKYNGTLNYEINDNNFSVIIMFEK